MTKTLFTIGPDDSLADAHAILKKYGLRRLPVVQDGELVGILSEYDMQGHRLMSMDAIPVKTVMTPNPVVVTPSETLEYAANLMTKRAIGALPVVSHGRLAGILCASDLMIPEPRPAAKWWPHH